MPPFPVITKQTGSHDTIPLMLDQKHVLDYGRLGRERNDWVSGITLCAWMSLLGLLGLAIGIGWFCIIFTQDGNQTSVTDVIEATMTTATGFVPLWVAWRISRMLKRK